MIRPLLLATALAVFAVSPVLGHAELERASPGPGDVVRAVPAELVARFTQNLDPRRSSMTLRSAENSALGEGRVTGAREMRMALPRLTPGTYAVRWTTYSTEDSEIARGTYTFRVTAAASPSPAATISAPPTQTASPAPSASPVPGGGDSSTIGVVLPVVAALAVVALLAARLFARR